MSTPFSDAFEAPLPAPPATADDFALVSALRAGDEEAFVRVVQQYHAALVRLASAYVHTPAAAEDVAQETWLGVLRGLERFEGRSSLKTWIFRICANRARTRGTRDSRSVPFSALTGDDGDGGPTVDPERFRPADAPYAGHWVSRPRDWEGEPEERLLSSEVQACIREAIAGLSPNQRQVITLRDIDGWEAADVCNVLGISETNQRVLLHRARSRVRRALEAYYDAS